MVTCNQVRFYQRSTFNPVSFGICGPKASETLASYYAMQTIHYSLATCISEKQHDPRIQLRNADYLLETTDHLHISNATCGPKTIMNSIRTKRNHTYSREETGRGDDVQREENENEENWGSVHVEPTHNRRILKDPSDSRYVLVPRDPEP